jgi:hypothetical protein
MAKPDIDALLNTQPPTPDRDITLVNQDGKPTSFYLDWFLAQTDWMRQNVVRTDKRIDTVKAESDEAIAEFSEDIEALVSADAAMVSQITTLTTTVGNNTSAIQNEVTARANGDSALAGQITTVNAKANNATANGEIFFAAKAAPGGATAAYGLYLTAGAAFAGMEILADSGGGGSIAFTANDFKLTDSGTAQNVFSYGFDSTVGKSVFKFNVPVQVQTIDIATEAVTKPRTVAINSSSTVGNTGGNWVNIINHTVQADGGSYPALVIADFMYRVVANSGTSDGDWRLVRDRNGNLDNLRSGSLIVFTNWFPVLTARLVTDVRDNDVFRLQVRVGGDSTAAFQFDDKAILVDLRKR